MKDKQCPTRCSTEEGLVISSRDFCFWLQGKLEIDEAKHGEGEYTEALSTAQVQVIKRHLAMVFAHEIDPSMGPTEHQAALSHLHGKQAPGEPVVRC